MIMNERNKLVYKIGDNMYALIEKKTYRKLSV